jgi:Ca-activated chloride channel homolog
MVLRAAWIIIIWLGLFIFFWKYWQKSRLKKSQKNHKPVANTKYIKQIPGYVEAIKKYKILVRATSLLAALLLVTMIILSMRPATKSTEAPQLRNRDIMLCLDVSGSMRKVNAKVVDVFAQLTKGFKGERIGLVIFDSSAATLFPLTDDYDYIIDMLNQTKEAFENEDYKKDVFDIFSGVSEGEGSSLIGDGLGSCVLRFDNKESKRSRSIILATDNYVSGNQIIDLKQAGLLAKESRIRVYGLNPSDYSTEFYKDKISEEYRTVVLSTDGDYYKFEQPSAVSEIIQKITSQEATRFKGSPILQVSDAPQVFIIVAFLLVVTLFILFWRLGI